MAKQTVWLLEYMVIWYSSVKSERVGLILYKMKLPSVKFFFFLYFVILITFSALNFSIVFFFSFWLTSRFILGKRNSSNSIGKFLTLMFGIGFVCNNGSPSYLLGEREGVRLFDEIKIYVTYLNRNSVYIFIRQAADTHTHTCIVNIKMLPENKIA